MNQVEVIARRIMGWKLNRWDRWYDPEKDLFIYDFQPEENLEHARMIVERLEQFGFTYTYSENRMFEVCINDVCETGETLAKAITNTAFSIAEVNSIDENWLPDFQD